MASLPNPNMSNLKPGTKKDTKMRIRAFPVSRSRDERASNGREENSRAVDLPEQQATASFDVLRLRLSDSQGLWDKKILLFMIIWAPGF